MAASVMGMLCSWLKDGAADRFKRVVEAVIVAEMTAIKRVIDVWNAEGLQTVVKQAHTNVQEEFIPLSGIEIDQPKAAQRRLPIAEAHHRVVLSPLFPDFRTQRAGLQIDGELEAAWQARVGRGAGRERRQRHDNPGGVVVRARAARG